MIRIDSDNKTARLAGFFYLLLAITGTFNFFVKEKLFEYANPEATANKISASLSLFTLSIVSEQIMATVWILIAITLYALFKKVSKNISFLMVSLVLVGGALVYLTVASQIAALVIVKNTTGYFASFDTTQIHALVMLCIDVARELAYANYIFMGIWMFPFAYLVMKSGFFPKTVSKIWGVLLIFGGLAYIIDFFTYFLFPGVFFHLTPFAFGGDMFSILWLLIMGVSHQKTDSA